ncbi:MAG: ABC transporter permease, partial [Deltaproteobacteria bacterium]
TTAEYFQVRAWQLASGSYFDGSQLRRSAQVCIIGETIRQSLFQNDDPVGQVIRLGTIPCRVIGVLRTKGVTFGLDQDAIVFLPISTVRSRLLHSVGSGVSSIPLSLEEEWAIPQSQSEISLLLRQRHRLQPGQPDDFRITSQSELLASFQAQRQAVSLLLTIVASIALLIGGIGVMNIMLVSVTERTREIGIRLAIGAQPADIMTQFMIESLTLSVLGGAGGWVLGALSSVVLSSVTSWNIQPDWRTAMLAFALSLTIGAVFGFLPARRAARLDPITALRHE